jgi:hypothetical protein
MNTILERQLDEVCKTGDQVDNQLKADLAYLRRLVFHLYHELQARPPAGVHLPPLEVPVAVVNKQSA